MPYILGWVIPGKLLYLYSYGEVTGEEIKRFSQEADAMLVNEGKKPASLISDSRHITQTKVSLLEIKNLFHRPSKDSALDWVFAISESPLLGFLEAATNQMMGIKGRRFRDLERALIFLIDLYPDWPPYDELLSLCQNWQATNLPESSA